MYQKLRLLSVRVSIGTVLLFLCSFLASAQQETRYSFVMAGNVAGHQSTVLQPDGTREIAFEYNDRGRGPKLRSQIKLDTNGLITSLATEGNDYLKAPVTERFTFDQSIATWKNQGESGDRKSGSAAFYVSMNGAPEETALLAQALLKANGQKLPLLPDGQATIRRAGDLTLKGASGIRHIILYEIDGLDFVPTTIWLDDDGTFFASVSSWVAVIREDWESSAAEILKKQDEIEGGRAIALAKALTRRPATSFAITNATLFDAETGRSYPRSNLLIEGNKIVAVGKSRTIPLPKNAEVIDARGQTVMPGLWDMHSHIFPNDGLLEIAAGVTTIRDLGNDIDALRDISGKIDQGTEIGPRILKAGLIDGRGQFTGPTKALVDTEVEAKAVIDEFARLGYVQIKIYSSIKPELVPKIIELAHAKGMRVSGHVPAFMNAEKFVRDGVDEFQHMNFFVLNFLFDTVKDTRTPARFTAVADGAAGLDLKSAQVRDFIKLLKDKKIVVDPTLSIFEGMFTDRAGTVSATFTPIADRLPPQVRRYSLTGGLPVPDGKDARYRDSFKRMLEILKLLYDSGVTIVAGTDSTPGFALQRELELYVAAGIPANEVLRIATIGAARVMKRDGELGSLAVGKLADLILVDGDPTRNISDMRRVSLVIKDGNIYQPAELYKAVGVKP